MEKNTCTSCGCEISPSEKFVLFDCPACGKVKIVRCSRCKNLSNEYTCKCGFKGP